MDLALLQGAPPVHAARRRSSTRDYTPRIGEEARHQRHKHHHGADPSTRTTRRQEHGGLTYFRDDLNPEVRQFFEQAGFKVVAMKGVDVSFSDVGKMPVEEICAKAKKLFVDSGEAIVSICWARDGIVWLRDRSIGTGSGYGLVLTDVPADVWASLKHLSIHGTD